MTNFKLQHFAEITGIGAASGLVFLNKSLYIIGDNSGFLYQYHIETKELQKYPLIENASENILKKDKPDFESITHRNNKLYVFGSGSTKNRDKRVTFNIESQEVKQKNVSELYQKFKAKANISNEDLNLEGSFYSHENLYMFNRGNGEKSKNGIFIYKKQTREVSFIPISLPKIQHIETSFTDAILVENKIYFLATAEDTISTYDDGEILGSIIGRIDIETFAIDFTQQISEKQKFEGLTLYSILENKINFLLCEDNDTEELQSNIYELKIEI
jgi:hypothetical protein